jgi:hypothetical protein
MINMKVLTTAAALALVLPMVVPTASFAEPPHRGPAVGGPRAGGAPVARFSAGAPGPRISAGAPVVRYGGGGGGVYRRGGGGGGFIPGAVAGALIGGAIASQSYGYYDGPVYAPPGYYNDQYYDDGAVAVAPAPEGDDSVAYCMQTYRSYDPRSGTYLGFDGFRHPCP